MDFPIFILLLCVLQGLCLYVSKKSSTDLATEEDYYVAGRTVSFFPLMMTFLATQVGGGLVLGSAEEAYRYGWTVLFYPLGSSLGLILLGLGVGRKLAQFNVSTIAKIFDVAYQSKILWKVASLLSIVSLFLILIAQFTASSKFMVSLGFTDKYLFIVFWAIVVLYTAIGGLKGVVSIDIIQASFFVCAFLLCFAYVFFSSTTPFLEVIQLGATDEQFVFSSSKLYGWLFMPLLFMVIEQDMGQRCFAALSPKVISKATICAGVITMIICFIPVYFGILAKEMGLVAADHSSILMLAMQKLTTPTLTAFAACAILYAIISTAISLINATSSNVSQDFGDLLKLNKNSLRTSQGLTAGIAVLGLGCSFYFTNVVDLLILSYELSVCCLFVPIFAAMFKPRGNTLSALLSVIFGLLGFIVFRYTSIDLPKELMNVLFSLCGYCLGEIITWIYRKC